MMMAKRSIPPPVIYLLWEIFGLKVPEVQAPESRGALVILSMIATSSPEMVKEKLPVLLGQGLGPRWKVRLLYVTLAFQVVHFLRTFNLLHSVY